MQALILALLLLSSFSATEARQEAAFISQNPALEITDFYAFTSYEIDREDYITLIMNLATHSSTNSGPSYPLFDKAGLYEFKIDVNGDAKEDRTFRFKFKQEETTETPSVILADKTISTPFISSGTITAGSETSRARKQSYQIEYIKKGQAFTYNKAFSKPKKALKVINNDSLVDDTKNFDVPEANIGSESITDYDAYANNFIYEIKIPRKKSGKNKFCSETAKVFAGPREDSFQANLSGLYDNINTDLTVAEDSQTNEYAANNVLSIILELPKSCLDMPGKNPDVIGVWASSYKSARQIVKNKPRFSRAILFAKDAYVQVSRAGNPLINNMLIGYGDKDLFNSSRPDQDQKRFHDYIEYPALATLIAAETTLTAPSNLPREDLEEVFLTGISDLNQLSVANKVKTIAEADMLRLNLTTEPLSQGAQNKLGILAEDNAGYPNGRRPGDDVVDIFYRLLFGARLDDAAIAPNKDDALSDGVSVDATEFQDEFPYLNSPN